MVRVVEDIFGVAMNPATKEYEAIKRFTLANDANMTVQVVTLGATITSIQVPDRGGNVDDIVLGYDDVAGYQTAMNPYFGATIGRVCNRTANGRFTLNGRGIQVSRNLNGRHHLHGGFVGFDKAHWTVSELHADGVTMQHYSPDGDEGYPGALTATLRYTLTGDNCLHVRMTAEPAEPQRTTVVNMTNHTYFNLAGHAAGKEAIYAHSIMIKADKLTETDGASIPTGQLVALAGSVYDLRVPCVLGDRLRNIAPAAGFDDNYCVELRNNAITMIAKVFHPGTSRWMEVASNQPGVQFYTGNNMPDIEAGELPIVGKGGAQYGKQSAFCLETQKYPDAVNHPNFPSITLQPGEKYDHEVIYKFGVCLAGGCAHLSANMDL